MQELHRSISSSSFGLRGLGIRQKSILTRDFLKASSRGAIREAQSFKHLPDGMRGGLRRHRQGWGSVTTVFHARTRETMLGFQAMAAGVGQHTDEMLPILVVGLT